MFLKYGRNIMYPATVAPIALIRTAPAATSLTALAFLLYSLKIISTTASIAVLSISAESTIRTTIATAMNSYRVMPMIRLKSIINIAAYK